MSAPAYFNRGGRHLSAYERRAVWVVAFYLLVAVVLIVWLQ